MEIGNTYERDLVDKVVIKLQENENNYKNKGEYFNLINIVGKETCEVGTHTPILADLLNPFGSHGQNIRFLKIFLEKLGIEIYYNSNIKVEREKGFCITRKDESKSITGQVDICIESQDHIIVIENKIYALDQPKQLYRYFQYAYKQSQIKKISIIYLSMKDQKPSKQSFGEIVADEEGKYFCNINDQRKDIDIYVINYGDHINEWLEVIASSCSIDSNLTSGIRQYRNLIQQMTGRIGKNRDDIKSMITDAKPIELKAINALSRIFNSSDYKGKLLYKFFEKIQNHLCLSTNFKEATTEKYNDIKFNAKNCKLWFEQISKSNPKTQRNNIGCVFESIRYPNLTFLVIVATDYLHYGVIIEDQNYFIEGLVPESWQIRNNWSKIRRDWIGFGLGDFRSWTKESLDLLSTNDNIVLDNFIAETLIEFNQIVDNYENAIKS